MLESHFPNCSLYLTSDSGVVGNFIISKNVFWQELSQIYLFGIKKIDPVMVKGTNALFFSAS